MNKTIQQTKTKEQIREKHLNLNGLSVTQNALGEKIKKAAYDAMEEYSQQQLQIERSLSNKLVEALEGLMKGVRDLQPLTAIEGLLVLQYCFCKSSIGRIQKQVARRKAKYVSNNLLIYFAFSN